MRIQKLNEELEKFIFNEISDELKASYKAGRQAQLDKAQKAMDKANAMIKKSDARQIANLPTSIDKETATDALEELKSEMRRIDSGSDWRLEEQDEQMCLSVRYWGRWSNPDDAEDEQDYDWQILDDEYREKLDDILTKIQKKYGVQIHEPGSEKNWLDFEIEIVVSTYDKILDLGFIDTTGPRQKQQDIMMLSSKKSSRGYRIDKRDTDLYIAAVLNNYGVNSSGPYRYSKDHSPVGTKEEVLQWILNNATEHLKRVEKRQRNIYQS